MMVKVILQFMERSKGDGRLGPSHINLFVALVFFGKDLAAGLSFDIARPRLMELAKIKARQSYGNRMRELHEYCYIIYMPSKKPYVASTAG